MYENWDTIAHEQVVPHRILVRETNVETLISQTRIRQLNKCIASSTRLQKLELGEGFLMTKNISAGVLETG